MNYLFSNAVAWFLSVLFAYVTNRKYVFDSKNNQIIKEAISFFGSRLATGIMDMVLMWFLVNFNIVNDVVAKVVVNVIVVILNYILSKLVVFMKVLSDQCLFIFAKISYFFRSENSIIYTIYEHILYMIKRKE